MSDNVKMVNRVPDKELDLLRTIGVRDDKICDLENIIQDLSKEITAKKAQINDLERYIDELKDRNYKINDLEKELTVKQVRIDDLEETLKITIAKANAANLIDSLKIVLNSIYGCAATEKGVAHVDYHALWCEEFKRRKELEDQLSSNKIARDMLEEDYKEAIEERDSRLALVETQLKHSNLMYAQKKQECTELKELAKKLDDDLMRQKAINNSLQYNIDKLKGLINDGGNDT